MKNKFIKALLIHVGTNLWYEIGNTNGGGGKVWKSAGSDQMRFDKKLFEELTAYLPECGINTVVLDLADGIVYNSHPELAINGSIAREELCEMIASLRSLGLDIIPKLNLSGCHDVWLKDYARMVSTKEYYKVCLDLIDEICEIFSPKIVHLGMDEENYENQKLYDYITIRNNDLWWDDLNLFVKAVEKNGARACIWSDYARHRPEEFIKKCPKSVIQCPWYYFNEFEGELSESAKIRLAPFKLLDDAGYECIAGGSNEYFDENIAMLNDYCNEKLSDERYIGIIQTTWASTTEEWRDVIFNAATLMKNI